MQKDRKLDYKDISLIPTKISTLNSRDEININEELFPGVYLSTPIISAPMVDVSNAYIVKEMRKAGGYGILHRFCSIEDQVKEFNEAGKDCAVAIGINGDYLDRFAGLYENGCKNYCLDVANAANTNLFLAIDNLLGLHSNVYFIVGNIASFETFIWCSRLKNVVAVRTGIGGGLACSTRNSTGIYHPSISLIQECGQCDGTVIADGGIREPGDFCKALAVGARFAMFGSLISQCCDSPAKIEDGRKIYRGSASFEIQQTYKEIPKYIEGRKTQLDYNKETVGGMLNRFSEGLKSSMSYMNARKLDEYRRNAEWCVIN